MLKSATAALLRIASTNAPAGIWLAIATIVPRLSAVPMPI
jgi:hypothetical protein